MIGCRPNISLQTFSTTPGNTQSIQITLQAPRNAGDPAVKPGAMFPTGKVHVTPGVSVGTAPPKVVLTHSLTPVLQHQTLAAKGNRGNYRSGGSVVECLPSEREVVGLIPYLLISETS